MGFGLHDRGWRGLDGLAIGKMDAADGVDRRVTMRCGFFVQFVAGGSSSEQC